MAVVQYTWSPVDSVARSRQVVYGMDWLEVTVLAIFLSEGKDVYIDIRPTLILSVGAYPAEPSATTTQPNLYELASSNRNAAYSQRKGALEKKRYAKECCCRCGALLEQSQDCVGSGRRCHSNANKLISRKTLGGLLEEWLAR